MVADGKKMSEMARYLLWRGCDVWDGVDESIRKDFPRSKSQFRIVHYASCRGMEGWTVVMHNADEYWHECRRIREAQGLSKEEVLAFGDLSEISDQYAWYRILIALTRPIDTLVIGLHDVRSVFAKVILSVAKRHPEYVEVVG